MSTLLFANNATTTIAGPITSSAVTVNLAAGTGALFPHPTTGQYFVATLTDAATGLINEIVWVTHVATDVLTIQRAQEGTVALAWSANDIFAQLWTAGQAAQMVQQGGSSTSNGIYYGTDAGTSNAIVATVSPVPTGYSNGAIFVIKKANSTNTGAMVANVASLGNVPVVNADGSALTQGQWPANARGETVYDTATASLCLLNVMPTAIANGGLGITAEAVASLNYGNLPAPVGAMSLTDGIAVNSTADSKIVLQPFSAIVAAIGTLPGQLLSSSGYQVFPGGLILQWINGPTDPSNNTAGITHTLSWPLTFPNACLASMATISIDLGDNRKGYEIYNATASQVSYIRIIYYEVPGELTTTFAVIFGIGY